MAVDVRTLFKIVGEEGPALHRVEEAMEWLLSPKAEDIGQRLLEDAHGLHGKPITIHVSTKFLRSGYALHEGEPLIHSNPDYLTKLVARAANGQAVHVSQEAFLAHELVHAGQNVDMNKVGESLKGAWDRAAQKAMADCSASEVNEMRVLSQKIQTAPDYSTARQHMEDFVDRFDIPIGKRKRTYVISDPAYTDYMERIEKPAIAMEQKIATIRGEPVRTDYADLHLPPDQLREWMIERLEKHFQMEKPPVGRADGNKWSNSLGDRSGRKLG